MLSQLRLVANPELRHANANWAIIEILECVEKHKKRHQRMTRLLDWCWRCEKNRQTWIDCEEDRRWKRRHAYSQRSFGEWKIDIYTKAYRELARTNKMLRKKIVMCLRCDQYTEAAARALVILCVQQFTSDSHKNCTFFPFLVCEKCHSIGQKVQRIRFMASCCDASDPS